MPTVPAYLNEVTSFKRTSEIWYLPICKDTSGAIIQNTAKGPYPKMQVEPVSIGIIKATVRKTTYGDSQYNSELNALNNGTWRGQAAGNAWIAKIDTEDVEEGETDVVEVRYQVYINEYGWKSYAPQLGYYYLSGGNPTVFTDAGGNPYLGCLNNSGAKLSSATDMIIKSWDIKRSISFAGIGF